MALRSEVAGEMSLDEIRYARVWEDEALLLAGLKVCPEDEVLSISSAGDNVLALLLSQPRRITAIDMSPAQNALLELKLTAIATLDHSEFLRLIGIRPGDDRVQLYQQVAGRLSPAARCFWDARLTSIQAGIADCGRLERYIGTFREEYLPDLWPAAARLRFFRAPDLASQANLFSAALTPEFRARFTWYFGRSMMERNGRDPAQFAHVSGEIGDYFLSRLHQVATTLPAAGNFYLELFLCGNYGAGEHQPSYLRLENYPRLRGLLERVEIVTDELERFLVEAPAGRFSKMNFSDVFEYMSPDLSAAIFEQVARTLRPSGRIAYWNLLVPRASPAGLRMHLSPCQTIAKALWQQDRVFFYRQFHLEEALAP